LRGDRVLYCSLCLCVFVSISCLLPRSLLTLPLALFGVDLSLHLLSPNAQVVEQSPTDEQALTKLTDIANTHSLRYACALLAPARVLAQVSGRVSVSVDDVNEATRLFRAVGAA